MLGGEIPDGLHDQNPRHGRHEEAKGDVAGCLNPRFAGRVFGRVHAINRPIAQDKCEVARLRKSVSEALQNAVVDYLQVRQVVSRQGWI